MGKAIELITTSATAPSSSGATFEAVSGDSLRVRTSRGAKLTALWHRRQVQGYTRVTSPLLHDSSVGIKVTGPPGTAWLWDGRQPLVSSDTLSVEGAGSGISGDVEYSFMMLHYEDVPGIAGRFITPAQLMTQVMDYTTVPCGTTITGTGYSGEQTLGDQVESLRAGTWYALLGAVFEGDDVGYGAIGIRAPDWGNLRVGIPVAPRSEQANWMSSSFFVRMSERIGVAMIPVFNSDNKDVILMDAVGDEDAGQLYGDLVLARLRGGPQAGGGRGRGPC